MDNQILRYVCEILRNQLYDTFERLHNQRFMLLKRFKMTYHFNHVRSSSPNYRKTE